ncbi:MAG TPA: hypothetical protein VK021_06385 [Flavobacteriaceae bacterium]|nr:hypothetical protein [Flavobacteriaceae bacterium]
MTHDGPIEVSAHIGNCSTSEQIDLPIDLKPWLGYSPKAVIQIVINSTPTKTAFPQYL